MDANIDDHDPLWWRTAQILFSKEVPEIADAELCEPFDMYGLWLWLTSAFADAYTKVPPNDALIGRVYEYAKWCSNQPRGSCAENDLLTCVVACFDEELPRIELAMKDMPRWFTRDDLVRFQETTLNRVLTTAETERWWTNWRAAFEKEPKEGAKRTGIIHDAP